MIIYATKKTSERYGLPDDLQPDGNVIYPLAVREEGNPLQEWGAKLFYFNRRKCLQVCNFASRFTLFLFNLNKADIDLIGELIAFYIYELYSDDEEMKLALAEMLGLRPKVFFSRLTDKRIIATLNSTQRTFAGDGDYFHRFVLDGELDTMEINRRFNFDYVITVKVDGEKLYLMPTEIFRKQVLEAYGRK